MWDGCFLLISSRKLSLPKRPHPNVDLGSTRPQQARIFEDNCLFVAQSCIDDVSEIWSDCCDTVAFQSNTFEVRNWAPEKNWGSKNATATAFTIAWPHDK